MLLTLVLATNLIRMAAPASSALMIAVAVLLLVTGVVVLLLARRPSDRRLSIVALGNTSCGFVLAFWLLASWNAFSTTGRLLVSVTVGGLVALAIGQLLASTTPPARER